jgi:hypothetical protein
VIFGNGNNAVFAYHRTTNKLIVEEIMLAIRLFSETHGGSDITWLLWVALGFFGLMVLVGWLTSRNQKLVAEVDQDHGAEHEKHAGHDKDDLVSLEGIGPKVAKVLLEAGINTFDGLATEKVTHVQEILNAAGLQMMNPEGWIEQAKLASRGDMEGLKKLKNELKGGRRK